MTGEPRRVGELLPGPDGGHLRFAGDDSRPWCVVLHGAAGGCGRGAVEVIFEPGMTYDGAVQAAAGALPQQHAHVVPVRSLTEWSGLMVVLAAVLAVIGIACTIAAAVLLPFGYLAWRRELRSEWEQAHPGLRWEDWH